MDGTGEILRVPSIGVLIEINRMFITASGEEFIGSDNLLYRDSLEYILEAVQHSAFGVDLFPTLFEKAAAIAERIILHHVFYGANKRTGLLTCATFLQLNGHTMRIYDETRFDENAVRTALAFQERQMSFAQFVVWLESRCVSVR